MSITDELRHNIEGAEQLYGCECKHLLAVADRIDAEHDKALNSVDDAYDSGYNVGYDEGFASADDWLAQHEDAMAEHGWARLPKDADNVPVSVGDVMEWVRYKDGDPTIVRTVSGIGNGVFFAWSDEQGRYAQYEAHAYRHHHTPTVEDVLTEFADLVRKERVELATIGKDAIAEYASKLRLAEGED